MGRSREAVLAYEKAVKLKPDWAQGHRNLALASFQAGDYDKVLAQLKEAIRLKPDYYEAYNNLGVLYHKQGNYSEASNSLRHAISLNPDYGDALFNLGALQLALRQKDAALSQYQKLKRVDPGLAAGLYGAIYRGMVLDLRNR